MDTNVTPPEHFNHKLVKHTHSFLRSLVSNSSTTFQKYAGENLGLRLVPMLSPFNVSDRDWVELVNQTTLNP